MIGVDEHWISQFLVYGFDNSNLCRAELMFEIDWDEYELQISRGKTTVTLIRDGKMRQLLKLMRLFGYSMNSCKRAN